MLRSFGRGMGERGRGSRGNQAASLVWKADAWVCEQAPAAPGRVTGGGSGAGRRAAEHLDAGTAGDRKHVREVRWPGERRGRGGVARGLAEVGEERLQAAGR